MSGLEPGFQLGHYRIVRSLGSGGMADVYEAHDDNLERTVALKILPVEYCRNPNLVARFQKEVRAAAKLNHRNIVTVFEVGQQDNWHFFSMRLLTGGDLRKRIEAGLTPVESLAILRELADAFAHAHARGFVHRDVKPENIMFDEQGFPVLTDFGIAKALDANTHMTRTGMTMGTPRYLSPEQASGKPVDARADLYSLGIILHEMLTGKPPYDAEESMAVIFKHVTEPVPVLPADFARYQALLEKLMAKDPARRIGSAEELIREIDAVAPRQATAELKQSQLRTAANPLVANLMTPSPLRTPAPRTPRPVTPPPLTPPPVAPPAPGPVVRDMSGEIAVRSPPVSAPPAPRAAPPRPAPAEAREPAAVAVRPAPVARKAAAPAARRLGPALIAGGVATVALAGGVAFYVLRDTPRAPAVTAPAAQPAAAQPATAQPAPAQPAPAQPDAAAQAEAARREQARQAELRRQAEAEAGRKAEADAQARQRADAEERQRAAAEAARQKAAADAQARQQAEAEARRKSELEARRRAEAEAQAKKRAEAEAEARRRAEAEAESRRRAEAEAEARRKVDADAEARRRAEEIEAAARQRDAEAAAQRAGKPLDPRAAAAEARRKAAEEKRSKEEKKDDAEEDEALERSRRPTGF